MTIRVLTPETIGKIAAGEVVERPASVVKELVENALDAGARRIAVEIRQGGNELIEVADDGCGMSGDDLSIAVLRHATSKLARFEDLDALATLGFRGEALPSIAAVSALTIRTAVPDATAGSLLTIDFGGVRPVRSAGATVGTTVTVRDLFGNVPARRKFLRQPATEAGYISRVVGAYALAYPAVRMSLTIDGRRVLATDGSGEDAAAAVGVHGHEIGPELLPLEPLDEGAVVPGVTVNGWVGSPRITRSHRQGLVFFVNGRWIQNRALGFALEEAYHSLLLVGRHPLALIHVALDPQAVDVNVHPAKTEIKFADERAVCRAVQRAAHAALARQPQDSLPAITFGEVPARPAQQPAFVRPTAWSQRQDHEPPLEQVPNGVPPAGHSSGLPILRVLGQVGGTYIIAEGPTGMYLIDQHAAHERVLYEKLLTQLQTQIVDRQPLLDPLVIELPPDELAVFDRSVGELRQIGFDAEPFGEGTIAVRAVPAIATGVDIVERLHLILQELADGGAGDSWLDSVAISAACHTSIRAGQALSLPEMRELVASLERSTQPRACGHGRPTMLHMSRTDLERQFSRR